MSVPPFYTSWALLLTEIYNSKSKHSARHIRFYSLLENWQNGWKIVVTAKVYYVLLTQKLKDMACKLVS